jgi:hypothetical protein
MDCSVLRLCNEGDFGLLRRPLNKVSSLRDFLTVSAFRMLKHTVNKVSSLRDFLSSMSSLSSLREDTAGTVVYMGGYCYT